MHERSKASGEAARFAALIPVHRLAAERKWDEARKQYLALLARIGLVTPYKRPKT